MAGGYDCTGSNKSQYNDDNGHGTHVAGIAAAKTGDSHGVRGVAPNARLYAVKVLNSQGSGFISWVICGVDWVTNNAAEKGIKVANMSLGFQGSSSTLNTAIANSVGKGVTYAVAAGNSAADATSFSPANHPDVITVSAMGDSDGKCGGAGAKTSDGPDDTFATFSKAYCPCQNAMLWLLGGVSTGHSTTGSLSTPAQVPTSSATVSCEAGWMRSPPRARW